MNRTFIINEEHLYELADLIIQKLQPEHTEPEKRYVTKQEALKILGVKNTTLQKLRDTQSIEFTYVGKRTILYRLQSLHDYMDSKCIPRI